MAVITLAVIYHGQPLEFSTIARPMEIRMALHVLADEIHAMVQNRVTPFFDILAPVVPIKPNQTQENGEP